MTEETLTVKEKIINNLVAALENLITTHNTDNTSHSDMRNRISALETQLLDLEEDLLA